MVEDNRCPTYASVTSTAGWELLTEACLVSLEPHLLLYKYKSKTHSVRFVALASPIIRLKMCRVPECEGFGIVLDEYDTILGKDHNID